MIRVFLADDHPVVRVGLRALLGVEPDIRVMAEARDGHEVLRALEAPSFEADVLILDLTMKGLSGFEVLRRARALRPALPIVVLSMYPEEPYADQVLALGAAGYVSKDRAEDELVHAVRSAALGHVAVRRKPARTPERDEPPAAHEHLSAREHQIFVALAEGRTVTDIAAELNLSVSTVSTHFGRIKAKLGIQTVAELVSYSHRLGLKP